MHKTTLITVFLLLWMFIASAQVSINTDGSAPDPSAMVDVNSTSRGLLPPRMTLAQKNAITNPAPGLIVFCTDCPEPDQLQVYSGTTWYPLSYNRPPFATRVYQSGSALEGTTLTGSFMYGDAENDLQGASAYKWYRADDASGLNETAISGATSVIYTVTTGDLSKYLRFAVTPVAQTGASPGSEARASAFLPPTFNCGISPLAVNHQATGGVAPENKSTTYTTAGDVPGEPGKCWITKNLGATQQAVSVDDATEASAGWYWQFNHKQGFKHDGTTRTPNTTWISNISEDSDWTAANDPCSLELGSSWRIPTFVEWNNVVGFGSWYSGTDLYNSSLHIHAAGELVAGGNLSSRGTYGRYWSSTQEDPATAYLLGFDASNASFGADVKRYGWSVRCLQGVCTGTLAAPVAGTNASSTDLITWNWNTVDGATGYKWNTVNEYSTATDMGETTSKTETGLACNTGFTRFIWAYNACGNSPATTLTQSTSALSAPIPGTHTVSFNAVIWNWSAVPGATGYKWSTANDFAGATDMGTATSKSEPGVAPNVVYTRYVWSYNGCGNSVVAILSQSTGNMFVCGQSFTVTHSVTGGVAPVNKTTTYFTVNNIAGEPAKCWITSNLGSDHRADSVYDASEPSAGWYWQFNRIQGYKHDGTTCTPTLPSNYINENSNWLPANDPCALLLGSGWRIPTVAEWSNVSVAGGWTNINGPWSSGLSMHAAGYLRYIVVDLKVLGRGSFGSYWTTLQYTNYAGSTFFFSSSYISIQSGDNKCFGMPIRCLHD